MISVIIPVYNSAVYLHQCIASIIDQSFSDWECIIVDDGSTDNSGVLCDEWAEKDPRIIAIHQDNGGVSVARNAGIITARGEYIAFVDSDDLVDKDYLRILNDTMLETKADLAVCGIVIDYADGKTGSCAPSERDVFELSTNNTDKFVYLNEQSLLYAPFVKLYKSTIIKNNDVFFDPRYSYGEDLLFNFNYLNYVRNIATVPNKLYHYRVSTDNSLSTKFRPDKFDVDYEQWTFLKNFYISKGMWNEVSKNLLFKRLWGIVYDGIFLYPKLSTKSIAYLKRILSIQEIDELDDYQELFSSSAWIKRAITMRCPFVFACFFNIKKG